MRNFLWSSLYPVVLLGLPSCSFEPAAPPATDPGPRTMRTETSETTSSRPDTGLPELDRTHPQALATATFALG